MDTATAPSLAALAAAALLALGAPARAQWEEVEAPTYVRVEALSISPRSGEAYVSLRPSSLIEIPGAGQARSRDGGASWRRAHSVQTPLLMQVVHHPTDPDVLWGADGSVWKSVDGGRTWEGHLPDINAIERLAVDPGDPSRVYGVGYVVAPGGGFQRSFDGGETWKASDPVPFDEYTDVLVLPAPGVGVVLVATEHGVHRSTDGGDTFAKVLGFHTLRLAAAAEDPSLVWATTEIPDGSTRVWQSFDGGLTWVARKTPAADVADLVPHPSDPDRAVAVASTGAFRTVDGGATWTKAAGVSPIANLKTLAVSPFDADVLLAGGVGGHGGVWRSADGGASWSRSSEGLRAAVGDFHFDDAGRVIALGLGVPVRLESGGWEAVDYIGGRTSTATSAASEAPGVLLWVNETEGQFEFDRLIRTLDDGVTWSQVTPQNAKSPFSQVRRVVFGTSGELFAVCQFGDLYESQGLGAPWTYLADGPWALVRRFVPDPHDPLRLHAIDKLGYYRSDDGGLTWATLPIGRVAALEAVDLSASPTSADELLVLAGDPQRELFRSVDGGDTWEAIGAGLPAGELTRLAVDPSDPDRVLVGGRNLGTYLSVDGGETFVPRLDGLGERTVVALAFDPGVPGKAWLSTVDGRMFVLELP